MFPEVHRARYREPNWNRADSLEAREAAYRATHAPSHERHAARRSRPESRRRTLRLAQALGHRVSDGSTQTAPALLRMRPEPQRGSRERRPNKLRLKWR